MPLVLLVAPVSVDDYFRIFHADWWWDHKSFSSSNEWLPGYFYFYGTVVGLFKDMVLVPRIATSTLHLLCGVVILYFERMETQPVRFFAAAWILLSPLMLLLGSVPLSESVYFLALISGVVSLRSYLESRRSLTLLASAVFYFAATMVRYEAWLLLPLFSVFAFSKKPKDSSVFLARILALLPWMFPLIWIVFLGAVTGRPFIFLDAIQEDHFGPSPGTQVFLTPVGLVTSAQLLLVLGFSIRNALALKKRVLDLSSMIWELHMWISLIGVIAIIVIEDVPSQFPTRILAPLLIFGAVPLASAVIGPRPDARRAWLTTMCTLFLAGIGVVMALNSPLGVSRSNIETAEKIVGDFSEGKLGPEDHVLLDHELPDAAIVYVHANRPENVHIDVLGSICPPAMFTFYNSICPLPEWAPSVRAAVVWDGGPEAFYLKSLRWDRGERIGDWVFFYRPDGAPFPGQIRSE